MFEENKKINDSSDYLDDICRYVKDLEKNTEKRVVIIDYLELL